jgi:hypothetical protein
VSSEQVNQTLLTAYCLLLTISGDHAGYRPPVLGIDRLEGFSRVHDPERRGQTNQLAGSQKMRVGGRTPARLTLRLEKGFHDE